MTQAPDPYRPANDDARQLLRDLIDQARFAALGVIDPATGFPMVSRIALVAGPDHRPLALISDLSPHTAALQANPKCSLLIGEPQGRGDPLTHPRVTLQASARLVRHGSTTHSALATAFVRRQPKAKLYIGFADFSLVQFDVTQVLLNGGFGKAYRLSPDDLHT